MAQVTVDVELDKFDTDELVSEVIDRLKIRLTSWRNKKLSENSEKELRLILKDLNEALNISLSSNEIDTSSLADQMKFEHITKVFNKYSLNEIESKLPL